MGPDRLRLVACGSVDAGKSTLIGRLLHEVGAIEDDRLATLGEIRDYSRVTDGLLAEREQGITIDVAHRSFRTDRRVYLLADAPGHDLYTRNMVHAASTADLGLLVVDATEGLTGQSHRHLAILRLMGVSHIVVAINKMDGVGDAEARFQDIKAALGDDGGLTVIPTIATTGANLRDPSPDWPWYKGPSLLQVLEAARPRPSSEGLRLPIDWVGRTDARIYAGSLRSGHLRQGDRVLIQPQGQIADVSGLFVAGAEASEAYAGEAVTLEFRQPVDIGRGDLICRADNPAPTAPGVEAHLIWMSAVPLVPGRRYRLKIGTRTLAATVRAIRHGLDPESGDSHAVDHLGLNDIGLCQVVFDGQVACDPYRQNPATGSFILIDPVTAETAAAGLIETLHHNRNLLLQSTGIDRAARQRLIGQRSRVLWFTGLSGAGKSTIADLVERDLHGRGRLTYLMDGDNLRQGLTEDLGFSETDRIENIRRVAEAARLFADAGIIVLVCLISPYRADRLAARERMAAGDFIEVFVDTSLAACEARDAKGLYAKARRGEIANFTGISAPYEAPLSAEIHLRTVGRTPEEMAAAVLAHLDGLQD
jgi:bifunctional enzyme CysN/CysC